MRMAIKKKKLILILLFLPHFEPEFFNDITPSIDSVFNILKVITALVGGYLIFKNRISIKAVVPAIAVNSMLIISTYLNQGDMNTVIINSISLIACCIIFCWGIYDVVNCLEALSFVYNILIYINFITVLIFPDGLYTKGPSLYYWFLGYDNTFVFYFIPSVCISIILSLIKTGKIGRKSIFLIGICTLTVLRTWSVASIIVMIMFWIYLIIMYFKLSIKLNPKVMTATILGINVGVVIFKIQNLFAYIIVNIFHKSTSLTGRDAIWEKALSDITNKPIIGYGYADIKFVLTDYFSVAHCHNYLLNLMYESGSIGLALFIWNIVLINNRLINYKKEKYSTIIMISILLMSLILVVDNYIKPIGIYILLLLGYFIKDIVITQPERVNNQIQNTKA